MEYAKDALIACIERHQKDVESLNNDIESLNKQRFVSQMKVQELTEVLRKIDTPINYGDCVVSAPPNPNNITKRGY